MRIPLQNCYLWVMAAALLSVCLCPRPAACGQDEDRRARSLAAYTMGVVYDMQGDLEDAVREYQRSADLKDHYAIHLRLGTAYARQGKLHDAVSEFEKVLKLDAENVQARYLLALVYSSQKQYGRAADNYEVILKTFSKADPQNVEIYGYLGQLYSAKKEYTKAISMFEKVLLLQPDNADVMYLLGSLYLEVFDRAQAKAVFLRCVENKPDHDGCLNSLGYMYAEDGTHLEEAQAYVERAMKIDPQNAAYLDSLGWVYFKKGQLDKALELLQNADTQIKDPVIYDHLGDVYFGLNKIEDAQKYWKLSLELLPEQPAVEKKLKSVSR